jgi:hypothetical protein
MYSTHWFEASAMSSRSWRYSRRWIRSLSERVMIRVSIWSGVRSVMRRLSMDSTERSGLGVAAVGEVSDLGGGR